MIVMTILLEMLQCYYVVTKLCHDYYRLGDGASIVRNEKMEMKTRQLYDQRWIPNLCSLLILCLT